MSSVHVCPVFVGVVESVLIQRPSVSSVYEVNGTETDWFVVNGHWSYVANEHTTRLAC